MEGMQPTCLTELTEYIKDNCVIKTDNIWDGKRTTWQEWMCWTPSGSHQIIHIKMQPSLKECNPCVLPLIWLRCACWYFWALAELKVSAFHCLLSGLNGLFELLNDTQPGNASCSQACWLPSKYKLPHSSEPESSSYHPKSCSQRLHLISAAPPSWHSKTIILLRRTKSWNQGKPVGAVRKAMAVHSYASGHNLSWKRVAISISTVAQPQRNHECIFSE